MTDDKSIKVIFPPNDNSLRYKKLGILPPALPATPGQRAVDPTIRGTDFGGRYRTARDQSVWELLDTYTTGITPALIKTSEQFRNKVCLPGPDPRSAQTSEEFVSKMRQMRAFTGLSLREISERAGVHGELPKSTLADVLKKKALPKDTLLRYFLRACGLTDNQAAVWESARRRIAMEEAS